MDGNEDPLLPLTREILDRVCPPSRASAIPPFQPERASIHWRRVSGGRALHAFTPDGEWPLCGVDPIRGNGNLSPWHPVGIGTYSYATFPPLGRRRRNHPHKVCQRLAERWAATR